MKHTNHRAVRIWLGVTIVTTGLLAASSRHAEASAFFSGELPLTAHQFIWNLQFVPAGTNVTFSTGNTTAGGDPVMQLFLSDGNPSDPVTPIPWVYADDNGASLDPALTVSGGPLGTWYMILVRSLSMGTAGRTDLFMNGSRILTQATFGGVRADMTWHSNQQLIATGTQRGAPNDMMLFQIDWQPFGGGSTIGAAAYDDDTGANLYASTITTSSSTSSSQVVYGLFPNSFGSGHLVKQDNPWSLFCDLGGHCDFYCTNFDSDADCVNDQLEPLIETSSIDFDSDNDHIPDGVELFGNDGWSFSEGGNNPSRGNIYVELDFMVGAGTTQNQTPYTGLPADVANIFNTDSGNTKRIDVVQSNALPYTNVIKYGSCSGGCVNFYNVKSSNFGRDTVGGVLQPKDTFRTGYFHYVVFGSRHTNSTNCSAGNAEVLGNDVIVSLNQIPLASGGCGASFSQIQQRGAFVHELGHNLNQLHGQWDDNGRNDGQNGTAHKSVMNYRYNLVGTDNRSGVFVTSYSFGTTPCTPCLSSPKKACIDFKNQNQCNTQAGTYCDCDWP